MIFMGGLIGLILLYYGAEFLVKGGSSIALKMKISPLVIGLTLVAYGTSAPELVVSADAALKGFGDVSIGNIVGSNICNIALILGVCAIITPLQVNKNLLKFDIYLMIITALALTGCYALSGGVNRWQGAVLLAGCISYTLWSIYSSRRQTAASEEVPPPPKYGIIVSLVLVAGGLAALIGGSKLFVNAAIALAQLCGVSDAVIGLTVVAVGTSLPELATSVVAAIRKEQDIAIGNVVGSNIFNVLAILGVAPLISPIKTQDISYVDMGLMVFVSILLYPMMKTGMKISRREGIVLLAIYVAYTAYLIIK
ncbi:MAG: calcium/sodium antiporter [Lentisphaerae bacterium]|nr:calcium/sodium antiporter [Lentisphaerota bacterium]